MKTLPFSVLSASLFVAASAVAGSVEMEWVTVGNAGNAADATTGFGAVDYEYRLGAFEVTNAQYTAFLNAVAASDPNRLYSSQMSFSSRSGIARSGSDGSYTYSVRPNMGDKPVVFVTWYSAARMANWMTNGQGAGDTESGVYTLDGRTSISGITRDPSNPSHVFLPTEDEWYKAAYHQPFAQGGDTDGYWLYATGSNGVPLIATATSTGDVGNPGPGVVNYFGSANWDGETTGHMTTVGSAGNTSFYGASDMNGNVWEWNETLVAEGVRGLRGGSYFDTEEGLLQSSFRFASDPGNLWLWDGFRLASGASIPADLSGDGCVDSDDLAILLAGWGGANADVDGDGTTGPADLAVLLASWQGDCP
jgi:formylglycine-generating enzyme required for sulfatase activity